MNQIHVVEVREEARRVFEICNACRYCEGFCAVFQEMTDHRTFDVAEIDHLANLCHNCTACYHACQYKPPHEFNVNVPRTLAELRPLTWQVYAWPQPFARALETNGIAVTLAICAVLATFLIAAFALVGQDTLSSTHTGPGAFYQVIGHSTIVFLAGGASLWAVLATTLSALAYKNVIGPMHQVAWSAVIKDLTSLRHLGGGHGDGCNEADDAFSNRRRIYHHLTMWGFLLCFAATCVATLYELVLDRLSPFPLLSLPVILGSVGGLGLIIGPIGFLLTNRKFHPDTRIATGMDNLFLILLLMISITGFLLLGFRETPLMGALLAVHLALVLAFFITLPYTKFVHAIYRTIAIARFHRDKG